MKPLKIPPITILVTKYEIINEKGKDIVFFHVKVTKKGCFTWTMHKRYSDFVEMNKLLSRKFKCLPDLPPKTYKFTKTLEDHEKRREGLESYLQTLVGREEIVNSLEFRKFADLDKYASDITAQPPKLLTEIRGFNQGIRDFIFDATNDLIFVAQNDMSAISRADKKFLGFTAGFQWLKNLKLTSHSNEESKSSERINKSEIGALFCFKKKEFGFDFELLWKRSLGKAQIRCIHWDNIDHYLFAGFEDGTLIILNVSPKDHFSSHFQAKFCNLEPSKLRITGIHYDSSTKTAYTTSKDGILGYFKVTGDVQLSTYDAAGAGLLCMKADTFHHRLIVGASNGKFCVIDISTGFPKLVYEAMIFEGNKLRSIDIDSKNSLLFLGEYSPGAFALLNLKEAEQKKRLSDAFFTKEMSKVRCGCFGPNRKELYIGYGNGTVKFWNTKSQVPILTIMLHSDEITQIQWIDKYQALITSSKDSTIKIWRLCENWALQVIDEEETD